MSMRNALPLLLLLAVLVLVGLVLAQTSADFDLSWHVIAGGGGRSASADYIVQGTAAQAAAGPPPSVGADYHLNSGFWYPPDFQVYLPLAVTP